MKTRIRNSCRLATLALSFGFVTCQAGDAFDLRPSDEERAIATAEEIVAKATQLYADEYWGGEMRSFAIAQETLDGLSDPSLKYGLRHVAEQLSSERAAWILRFWTDFFDESSYLGVMFWDLLKDDCCMAIDVLLARNEEGEWRIEAFASGSHAEETDESRAERLARRAELLRGTT